MSGTARRAMVAVLTMISAALLGIASIGLGSLAWAATTALIVPGTGTPDPSVKPGYMGNAVSYYIQPTGACTPADCTPEPIKYYATFWPIPLPGWGGLDGQKWNVSVADGVGYLNRAYGSGPDAGDHTVIFGYSQGATVASIVKGQLATHGTDGHIPANTSFVFIGNPNRPSGGVFERLALLGTVPILDATFGQPTPTNTTKPNPDGTLPVNTTDIAFQYDGVADFPKYPINVLADLNALAGFWYVHGTYLDPNNGGTGQPWGYTPGEIQDIVSGCAADNSGFGCQKADASDTLYVTLPAKSLPLAQPFLDLADSTGTGFLIKPVVAALQPALQTLIETGYDRSDYSSPSPFGIVPLVNPIKLATDLVNDIPEGFNAAKTTIETGNIPDLPGSTAPAPASARVAPQTENSPLRVVSGTESGDDEGPAADSPAATRPQLGKSLAKVLKFPDPAAKLKAKKQLVNVQAAADSTAAGDNDTATDGTDQAAAPKNDRPRPVRDLIRSVKNSLNKATAASKPKPKAADAPAA
ncbi:PE-PPE domain-containing protein [Mycolicibacterium fallax]|uniref:PE-PPE domain-containing protein n=1 Tax=Mycolicibacterium fallax TaxID=1793 RepID=A0A1X1RGM2_MYCFA|nr:PE-PPE domain-containing protein [Mycolicibacterium fallax]ORV05509.1 hypothetical protein AWC04_06525 [Mycolicibacterium fallax]BBY96959.1 PE-PPE domain-containing protein [Mycolicibacterium fallax]